MEELRKHILQQKHQFPLHHSQFQYHPALDPLSILQDCQAVNSYGNKGMLTEMN